MEYPQQTEIHAMIELIHRELKKADERGEVELPVAYSAIPENAGIFIGGNMAPEHNAAIPLGFSGGKTLRLFRYVCWEGYVSMSPGSDLSNSSDYVTVDYITPLGLLEIGELPDPQQRFLMGLDAAIQAIREDDRIPDEERQRGIDWAEEGKLLARPLVIEVFKAMWRGQLPLT